MSVLGGTLNPLLPVGQAGFYFQNWEFNASQAAKPLTFTLALVLFLTMLYAGVSIHRKWSSRKSTGFSVQDNVKIAMIIRQAIHERSTYEVRFQDGKEHRVHFTCAPLSFEPDQGITLEVSGYIKPQPTWIGRSVTCYFKVATNKKEMKWAFFNFSSTVTGLFQKHGVQCILLNTPQRLERKQRRSHLRLDPPSDDIPEVRLWPETFSNLAHPDDVAPMLWFRNSQPENQCFILNLSAGGMLLEVRAPVYPETQESLEKGKRLFISLFLRDLEKPTINEFRLLAQVRNVFTDPATGRLLVGLSFVAHQPREQNEPQITWNPLGDKGFEAIEDWVFKRHLQIYQQKGLV